MKNPAKQRLNAYIYDSSNLIGSDGKKVPDDTFKHKVPGEFLEIPLTDMLAILPKAKACPVRGHSN